jgi:type IV pilus assembly protein PilC
MATATATKTFEYSVRDKTGKLVKGKLEAPNETALVQKLRGMGYAPLSVKESKSTGMSMEIKLPGSNKVGLKDLAIMSRQFATMIDSGLSLMRALSILS